MTPSKIRKNEPRYQKSFLRRLILMLRRRKSTGRYGNLFANTTEYLKKVKAVILLNTGGLEVRMIDCCELALYNAQLALRIALGAFALIALLFAMVFGYNLK